MSERAERRKVALGFRAFDVHELLPHFVARSLGYYKQKDLQVTLRDVNFLPDRQRDAPFTVSCGAALMDWLKGIRMKVVFVATDYPMFWLHTRPEIREILALKRARIATYPPGAPPAHFLRMILGKYGLDPDQDVRLEAARDDVARLGLLASGDVAAAVVSSAIPPPKVESAGLRTLLFFGDEIRIPTTGLAIPEDLLEDQSKPVRDMVAAFHRGIVEIHQSPEKVIPIMAEVWGDSPKMVEQSYNLLCNYFTRDGRAEPQAERNAVEFVNQQIPCERKLRPEEIYDYSFLAG